MRHSLSFASAIILLGFLFLGRIHAETWTFVAATNVVPEKTISDVRSAVSFLCKQPQPIPVKFVTYETPVAFMTDLRDQRRQINVDPTITFTPVVHNLDNYDCVEWGIPKVYRKDKPVSGKRNCPTCQGRGSKDKFYQKTEMVKCPECLGLGKKLGGQSNRRTLESLYLTCSRCRGEGKVASDHTATTQERCSDCNGTGKLDTQGVSSCLFVYLPAYKEPENTSKGSK